jgi:hypothetical protein
MFYINANYTQYIDCSSKIKEKWRERELKSRRK